MRVATFSLCLGACSSTVLAALNPSTTGTSTPSSTPQQLMSSPPPTNGAANSSYTHGGANSSCTAQSLTPDTWNHLQLDKYLAEYPGGKNLTLFEYAESKGAQNYQCGMEKPCIIDQICNPVAAPDWYILLAVQEWNNCMNSVYKAVHYAVTTVQGTLALMITSIAERNLEAHQIMFEGAALVALIAAASAVLAMGASALLLMGWVGILSGLAIGFGSTAAIGIETAPVAFLTSDLLAAKPSDRKRFIKWASVGNAFSQWEIHMQSMITNTTQTVINSPISSPAGISGVVRNGAFLFETPPKSTSDLQTEYETVLQARSLVQGAYITRGSDKCDKSGPNGARGGDEYLSYCGPDKIMMNIVLARGDKTQNKIKNAQYISSKFGFTTEYLVTQSWDCQQKHGHFQPDPYRDAPLPANPYSDCVVNLPVCDLTDQKINLARHGKNHHTTSACRNQGGLPI